MLGITQTIAGPLKYLLVKMSESILTPKIIKKKITVEEMAQRYEVNFPKTGKWLVGGT